MKAEESPLLEIAACSGNILVSYVVKGGGRVPIYFKNCPRRGRSVMNTMGERRRHNDGYTSHVVSQSLQLHYKNCATRDLTWIVRVGVTFAAWRETRTADTVLDVGRTNQSISFQKMTCLDHKRRLRSQARSPYKLPRSSKSYQDQRPGSHNRTCSSCPW